MPTSKRRNNLRLISLPNALSLLLFFFCGSLMLFTIYINVDYFTRMYSIRAVFMLAFALFLLIVAIRMIYRLRMETYKLLFVLIIMSLVIRSVIVHAVDTPVESDFYLMYEAAKQVVSGDFSWMEMGYFKNWAYQIPFVMFEALLLKISSSIWILKTANVIFMLFSNILVYSITKRLVSERAGIVAFFLYMIYPAPILLGSVLTNQHGATTFFLLSIYFLIKGNHWKWPVFAALSCVIGGLFRADSSVILLAVFAVGVFSLIWVCVTKEKKALRALRSAGVFLLVVVAANATISTIADVSGFSEGGFKNNCPQWKFVTGLNPNSTGQYAETDLHILGIDDSKEAWEETFRIVKAYLKETKVGKFFGDKLEIMWAHKETYSWGFGHFDMDRLIIGNQTVRKLLDIFTIYDKAVYILVWVLSFLCMTQQALKHLNSRERFKGDMRIHLLALIFFANYAAYVIIEIQTRYRYFIMPFLFVLAGVAVGKLMGDDVTNGKTQWAFPTGRLY